jgi:hypothetical protein
MAQGISERGLSEKRALIEHLFADRQKTIQKPMAGAVQEETYLLPHLLDEARQHSGRFGRMLRDRLEPEIAH